MHLPLTDGDGGRAIDGSASSDRGEGGVSVQHPRGDDAVVHVVEEQL